MTEIETAFDYRILRVPMAILAVFFCLFAALRSRDIFAVDGAHRCLQVWHRQGIFLDGTNHMLYPVNVFVWTRLGYALGFNASGPLQFFSMVELMNCLAGAACLACLCLLMYLTVPSWSNAVSVTVGYGFSKAFIEQATNANQPLVGALSSILGLLFASLAFKSKSNWPIVVSAFLFSLAMANYESMIFLAPAAIFLIWRSRDLCMPKLLAIGSFAVSGVIGSALIFGLAFRYSGIANPNAMVRQLRVVEGERAYAGQGLMHLLNVPVGMVRNIFPVLRVYTGLRNLAAVPEGILVLTLLLFAAFYGFSIFCAVQVWKQRSTLSELQRTAFLAGCIGFVSTTIPLLLYDPHYDKLWLQPLGCAAFLLFLALDVVRKTSRPCSLIVKVSAALLLVGVLTNSVWAMRGHSSPTLGMEQAQGIAEKLSPGDYVIGGWDDLAVMYSDLWAPAGQYMDFFMEAGSYGRAATSHVREAALRTRKMGGHFYFIGVVDVSKDTWDSYLGSRCGVPFSDFDSYRAHSRAVASYRVGSSEVSLFQFDLNYID